MTLTLIIISCILFFAIRLLDAIKSGCFYAADRDADPRPKLLEMYMKNMHFVQTPLWYCVFGAFSILLFIIFSLLHPQALWLNILSAYLVSAGTSAACGPLYQGFINVGGGEPFVNENENPKMELANPISKLTTKISRFWYGRRRIYLAFFGVAEIVAGLIIIFYYL